MKEFCKYPIDNEKWLLEISNYHNRYFTIMIHYKDKLQFCLWFYKPNISKYISLEIFGKRIFYIRLKKK